MVFTPRAVGRKGRRAFLSSLVVLDARGPHRLDGVLSREIKDSASMTLERLARQDLREQIRRIRICADVLHDDDACTAQFAHLKQLSIDMT